LLADVGPDCSPITTIVAQDDENFLDRSKTLMVFSTDEVEY
jgi:hypothetical protein